MREAIHPVSQTRFSGELLVSLSFTAFSRQPGSRDLTPSPCLSRFPLKAMQMPIGRINPETSLVGECTHGAIAIMSTICAQCMPLLKRTYDFMADSFRAANLQFLQLMALEFHCNSYNSDQFNSSDARKKRYSIVRTTSDQSSSAARILDEESSGSGDHRF